MKKVTYDLTCINGIFLIEKLTYFEVLAESTPLFSGDDSFEGGGVSKQARLLLLVLSSELRLRSCKKP